MSSPTPRISMDSFTSPFSPTSSTNEYPFPRNELSHRPSSTGRYQPRRGSTASSIHSIGGTLDSSSHPWPYALAESGQNAISTLLQPPIVRTGLVPHTAPPPSSAHKQPTARDIPPVPLTNIPHIDNSEFTSYLTQVGSLYDALQRAKENDDTTSSHFSRKASKGDELADYLEMSLQQQGGRRKLSRQTSLASITSMSPDSTPRRRSSGGGTRRIQQAPTPLSTIPNVYFDQDFHLENPRTFDIVSERSEVVRPTPGTPDERRTTNGTTVGPRKALATNAILQEKLSWYMDTIEVHLIASISTASSSFFAALGSLRELHAEAADSVNRIKILRQELETLDKDVAMGGLDIVKQKRRRENLKQLSDAVQQLKLIVRGVNQCENLVDAGQVEEALSAIDGLEKLIAGQTSRSTGISLEIANPRDLRGATALQSVNSDLDTLRYRIGKTYESRFLSTLLGDLRRHVESTSPQDILQRWNNASNRSRGGHNREPSAYPAYLSVDPQFRSTLLANLNGLHQSRHATPGTTAYKEAVMKEIRAIIRRPLPSSNDDDNESTMSSSTVGGRHLSQQEKSSILARNLRALDPETAEELFCRIYVGVGETMRRLSTQVKVLLDVTSSIDNPQPNAGLKSPLSPNPATDARHPNAVDNRPASLQEEVHHALDMSNLLGQAVDLAHTQIVKVLRVRSEQSSHLSLPHFLRYFTLNFLFANECEAISGRGGQSLKSVVNGHIQDFSQQLAESERQKLAEGMESDNWNAKDFGDKHKVLLDRILESSTRDPDAWSNTSKIWLPIPESDTETVITNGATPASSKDKTRSATIESESFILPGAAMLCLQGISQHLHLITGIPSITHEVATALISYLQVFDSLCKQLILGAGAIVSAGLKNITTKHLALASQALAFVTTLIPHIREFVRRHSAAGQQTSTLMGEFDKVKRAYQEHQSNIYDKLAEIMSGRSNVAVRTMKTIDWDAPGHDGSVSPYMETLAKETGTLHRVLSKHLPDMTILMIMSPVFKSYREQWSQAFKGVTVKTETGKKRLLKDAEFFSSRMGKLDGAGDLGEYIVTVVKEKQVDQPAAQVPTEETAVQAPATTQEPATETSVTANGETGSDAGPSPSGETKQVNGNETGQDAAA